MCLLCLIAPLKQRASLKQGWKVSCVPDTVPRHAFSELVLELPLLDAGFEEGLDADEEEEGSEFEDDGELDDDAHLYHVPSEPLSFFQGLMGG